MRKRPKQEEKNNIEEKQNEWKRDREKTADEGKK